MTLPSRAAVEAAYQHANQELEYGGNRALSQVEKMLEAAYAVDFPAGAPQSEPVNTVAQFLRERKEIAIEREEWARAADWRGAEFRLEQEFLRAGHNAQAGEDEGNKCPMCGGPAEYMPVGSGWSSSKPWRSTARDFPAGAPQAGGVDSPPTKAADMHQTAPASPAPASSLRGEISEEERLVAGLNKQLGAGGPLERDMRGYNVYYTARQVREAVRAILRESRRREER